MYSETFHALSSRSEETEGKNVSILRHCDSVRRITCLGPQLSNSIIIDSKQSYALVKLHRTSLLISQESLLKTKSSTSSALLECDFHNILWSKPPSSTNGLLLYLQFSKAQPPLHPCPSIQSTQHCVECTNTPQEPMLGQSESAASSAFGPDRGELKPCAAQLLGNKKPTCRRCRDQLVPLCNDSLSRSTGLRMPRVW